MAYYTPKPANFDVNAAFDYRGMEQLRQKVSGEGGTDAQNREVAQQFESLFLQMMIRRMREATPQDGLFESDQTRMVRSLADEQLATQLANPGIGLAQALLNQIQAQQGGQAGEGMAALQQRAPELASSRVPGLQSRTLLEATDAGPSVAAPVVRLLESLTGGRVAAAQGAGDASSSRVHDFINRMAVPARRAAASLGIPTPVVLAQAALESGWGAREIRHPDGRTSHNLFGIKATGGWKGEVVEVMTTEYENGVARKVKQPFRAYRSYAESFADYARLLSENPRYEQVLSARTAPEAARKLQAAGYATDPGYADKLISIMSRFTDKSGQGAERRNYAVSLR